MRERVRFLIEVAGACLLILALAIVHIALGIFAAGLLLVVIANVYMGENDASTDRDDPPD